LEKGRSGWWWGRRRGGRRWKRRSEREREVDRSLSHCLRCLQKKGEKGEQGTPAKKQKKHAMTKNTVKQGSRAVYMMRTRQVAKQKQKQESGFLVI